VLHYSYAYLCAQVNACIDKYLYTQRASRLAARLQREGKEVPRTFEGMSKLMGAPLWLLCIGAAAGTLQAHGGRSKAHVCALIAPASA